MIKNSEGFVPEKYGLMPHRYTNLAGAYRAIFFTKKLEDPTEGSQYQLQLELDFTTRTSPDQAKGVKVLEQLENGRRTVASGNGRYGEEFTSVKKAVEALAQVIVDRGETLGYPEEDEGKTTEVEKYLRLSRKTYHGITGDEEETLRNLYRHPTQQTFESAHMINIGSSGTSIRLGLAIRAVDHTFPYGHTTAGRLEIPNRKTVRRALEYAVLEHRKKDYYDVRTEDGTNVLVKAEPCCEIIVESLSYGSPSLVTRSTVTSRMNPALPAEEAVLHGYARFYDTEHGELLLETYERQRPWAAQRAATARTIDDATAILDNYGLDTSRYEAYLDLEKRTVKFVNDVSHEAVVFEGITTGDRGRLLSVQSIRLD